jgi:hypothetical protein
MARRNLKYVVGTGGGGGDGDCCGGGFVAVDMCYIVIFILFI